jgi:superfamily I DNA/RNA helicase
MKPAALVTDSHVTVFLSGPPGTGKTSLAIRRLYHLLESGVPAEQILVLVPHRALARPYFEAISSPRVPAGGQVDLATIGGLAHRTIDLFWPLIARAAGFERAALRPRFLTLETAQYYMGRVIQPYLEAGAFEGITISRARLVSQIIDNLNKSAAVGFPIDEIATRLARTWAGESARLRVFDQVQAVASGFRSLCLAENVLDWSLQIQLFTQHLLPLPQLRRYLLGGYRHLIVDNVEEDIPAMHDLLHAWLPLSESALIVYDDDGGHRVFLGADPAGALALAQVCHERVKILRSHITSPGTASLGKQLAGRTDRGKSPVRLARQALVLPAESIRFHPQMLDWVASEVGRLITERGVSPGEIVLLSPFVSDALRFSIEERLTRYGVPLQTHRPSRQLREEPTVRCLLTLSKLAHPTWRLAPPPEDVAEALTQAITGMDPTAGPPWFPSARSARLCRSALALCWAGAMPSSCNGSSRTLPAGGSGHRPARRLPLTASRSTTSSAGSSKS